MRKRLLAISILLALCLSAQATITERYVSSAAGGGGDGSSGAPWTLAEAISNYSAGDRMNLKGTFTLSGGVTIPAGAIDQPSIWRGYSTTITDGYQGRTNGSGALVTTNFATIACGASYYVTAINNYTVLENLNITGSRSGYVVDNSHVASAIVNCRVENSSTNAAAFGLVTGNAFNCDIVMSGATGAYTACKMNVVGGLHECQIWRASSDASIGVGFATYTNGVIDKCTIHGATGTGIKCDNMSMPWILNCTIQGQTTAISTYNGAAAKMLYVTNCMITDCTASFTNPYAATAAHYAGLYGNRTRDNGAVSGFGDWPAWNEVTTDTGGPETDYESAATGDLRLIAASPAVQSSVPPYGDIGAQQAVATGGDAPDAGDLRAGVTVGAVTGTLDIITTGGLILAGYTQDGGAVEGTCTLPEEAQVEADVTYGADGTQFTGTLETEAVTTKRNIFVWN